MERRKRVVKKTPPKRKPRRVTSAPIEEEPKGLTLKDVEVDIAQIGEKRATISALQEDVKGHQERVVEALQNTKTKSHKVEINGQAWGVTLVEGTSVVLDEGKLKKRIGAALWNKITTRSLDKKKLEAFIASGEIKSTDVAACSDLIPKTPFTKITKK